MTVTWATMPVEERRERLGTQLEPSAFAHCDDDELVSLCEFVFGPDVPTENEPFDPMANLRDVLAARRGPTPEADAAVEKWRAGAELVPEHEPKLPSMTTVQMLDHLAARYARSAYVPKDLKNKPDDCFVVLMHAHDLGISASMAVTEMQLFGGKVAKSAYLLGYLVRRDGHRLWTKVDYDSHGRPVAVDAFGIRKDDPTTTHHVRYTIDEAIHAGLCYRDEQGEVRARDGENRPKPWEQYTEDMLVARATSRICRRYFQDSTGGAAYTPDELGFVVNLDGEEILPTNPAEQEVPLDALSQEQLRERIDALSPELRAEVAALWKQRRFPAGIENLLSRHWGPIDAIVFAREKRMPEDATVLEDVATVDGQSESFAETESGLVGALVDQLDAAIANAATPAAATVCETCGAEPNEPHEEGCDDPSNT